MESGTKITEMKPQSTEVIDAAAMLAALDAMNGGPAQRIMQTIGDQQGDLPANNPRHDLMDK